MSRRLEASSHLEHKVDDTSEYLLARSARWYRKSKGKTGRLILIDVGNDFDEAHADEAVRQESKKQGVTLYLADNLHLERFVKNDWNKKVSVVAFGSYVEHPDLGRQYALLIANNPSGIVMFSAKKRLSKEVRLLCVAA